MPTPPMLRPREGRPESTRGLDPVLALTVFVLALIALGLLLAAFLAVYTYSTPAIEVPLVVALSVAFGLLVVINVVRLGIRQVRQLVTGR